MKLKIALHRMLAFGFFAAASILLFSFSPLNCNSGIPESDLNPSYNAVSLSSSESYNPEFNLNADSVIIPLKRAGHLFLIEANIDGEEGNLVFDTGANNLVLNSTYFRNHTKTGSTNSNGITGSVGLVDQISVDQIKISDLVYKHLRADLANLGHIESRRNVKILGLIGFGMMRNLEIVIDPVNNELKLFRIDKSGKRQNSKLATFISDYSMKFEVKSNILFLEGKIGGKLLNFCFDTGAETNAVSSDLNKKILSTITITRRTTLKGAGATVSEVLFGRMNDFTIGSQQLKNMETIITNLDAVSEAYGSTINGMLGYSFLEHGVICVNFVKNQFSIRFTKGEGK